tara:strand:+ start:587 stop:763 length:177 start_codon:yes stop_codon:yes gene_type:complete
VTDRTEHIDDKEEYLKITIKINQVKIKIIKYSKEKTNIIPRNVATPLPPLNLSQIENI